MRTVKWNAFLSGLCSFAVALGVVAASAHADVTTEKGASILVFPKVRADDDFDTIIQITNTGNSMVHARCYYVNASLACQETDFTIWLTKQQPTHWLVSSGRRDDPFDGFGSDGSGLDPGNVPPTSGFRGELKCVEVDEFDQPTIGNHLKGEATIKTISGDDSGDVSKYNAIGIVGNASKQATNPLHLDGTIYDACPAKLIVNNFAEGDEDLVAVDTDADSSSTSTELTLVPCTEDFENQKPSTVTVQFLVFNEFEERFSASTTLTCLLSTTLSDIDSPSLPGNSLFSRGVLGTDVAQTEITPVPNRDGSLNSAVIGIVERTTSVTSSTVTRTARSANNVHTAGDVVPATDTIHLTEQE